MILKELKSTLKAVDEPIDRIAGFCDNYEQMFSRCSVKVRDGDRTVLIDTTDVVDEENDCEVVPRCIANLLAMPAEIDDYHVVYSGFDSNEENVVESRSIGRVRLMRGASGVGVSMQGPVPCDWMDDELFVTKLFVNDSRARLSNDTFHAFIEEMNLTTDVYDLVRETSDGVYVKLITDATRSSSLIALMAGTFRNVVFCRTPLVSNEKVINRLTNDREGRYWGKHAAVFAPADTRDSIIFAEHSIYNYFIEDFPYAKVECDTVQEAEQYLARTQADPEVGDIALRIVSQYIDDPLDLILKPWPEDDHE